MCERLGVVDVIRGLWGSELRGGGGDGLPGV